MRGSATPTGQRSPIGDTPMKDAAWMHANFRQERAWSDRAKRVTRQAKVAENARNGDQIKYVKNDVPASLSNKRSQSGPYLVASPTKIKPHLGDGNFPPRRSSAG
jgi:hypothetical protein